MYLVPEHLRPVNDDQLCGRIIKSVATSWGEESVQFGELRITSLLFVDDVILLASSHYDLHRTLGWFSGCNSLHKAYCITGGHMGKKLVQSKYRCI